MEKVLLVLAMPVLMFTGFTETEQTEQAELDRQTGLDRQALIEALDCYIAFCKDYLRIFAERKDLDINQLQDICRTYYRACKDAGFKRK